jgi:hypothetical protein
VKTAGQESRVLFCLERRKLVFKRRRISVGESGTGREMPARIYSRGKGNKRYVLLVLLACLSVVPF